MIRRKYFVPQNEIYRAYEDGKSKEPKDYIFKTDYYSALDREDDEPIMNEGDKPYGSEDNI